MEARSQVQGDSLGVAPLVPPAGGGFDEAAFRTIIDAVPQMMWVNDADGAVRFFNRAGLAYLGAANDVLEGRRWLAWLHPDDREVVAGVRAAAIAEGHGYAVEGRFRRHDGAYRWQRFEVQPVRAAGGALAGWIGSARDVQDEHDRAAERERLLAEMAAQRALFQAAYEHAPVGMTISGADGRMIEFNAEAERLLGHAVVPTREPADFVRYRAEHEDGTPYAAEEYATTRALRGVAVRQELMRYRRGDGTLAFLRVSGEPVRDAAGRVTHAVCTFVDVTEREAAERALAEREERLRAALDAARTGTFRWDIRTDALDWDENLDRLFGRRPGESVRSLEHFVAAVHPDDRARVVAACARCAAEGADFDEELRVVWPDGTVRWLHDVGRTHRDAEGRPAYMTGACVDITERRRQADELRALAETMPQLVWMARPDGRLDYFNRRWEEYAGVPTESLAAGAQVPGMVHGDDLPIMGELWARALATGEPYEATYRLRRADGAYRWFVGRALPARDENGRVVRWFGSATDIHDEVLVRERVERLKAVTEALAGALGADAVAGIAVHQGMAALGAQAGALACLLPDGATLELVGEAGAPDAVGEAGRRFALDAPVPMADVVRTGAPLYVESRAALLDRFPAVASAASQAQVQAAAVLPLAWGGRALGGISYLFDAPRAFDAATRAFLETLARQCAQALDRTRLLERERRAREEAEAARSEAQRANQAKGAFLAMMSHDLRTPINATLGYAELMALGIRGPLTAEQAHDLGRVQRSQRALLALVNEVLEYTRIEAGRVECRRDPLPLREVVGDVAAIVEPLAAERGLRLEVAAPSPDVVATGDRDRVRQVLLNLLSNAVKFTDAGTVRLTTEADATWVRVRVADTGRGIAPERLAAVFEPFVQLPVDARPTGERHGVGLGLAIARDLARAMGGDVLAESVEGAGSTFTLVLERG